MNLDVRRPCADCPFRREGGIRLSKARIREIAAFVAPRDGQGGTFACHKTTGVESGEHVSSRKQSHCAGAILFADKQGTCSQYVRIAAGISRLSIADFHGADDVFDSPREMLASAIDAKPAGAK